MNWKDVWVEKWRPATLDDIVLAPDIRKFLESLRKDSNDTGAIPNLLFSGPPGCGKSSLAKVIAEDILNCQYLYINGSEETSIEIVRTKIMGFAQTKSIDGKLKLIILDEADGLSGSNVGARSSAQAALKNVIEQYSANTRFIFTTNHPDKIIEAIHSRCLHLTITLSEKDCAKQALKILKAEGVKVPPDQVKNFRKLVANLAPDLRNIMMQLQKASLDGVLNITHYPNMKVFAKTLLDSVLNKAEILDIREKVIKNEDGFNLDYHELLKNLFNGLMTDYPSLEKKRKIQMALVISDAMVNHFNVSDKEINFSACLFRLGQIV